jgi:Na+-translocating ferredoxin:NAD+ oxidoreductase RnfD subunit
VILGALGVRFLGGLGAYSLVVLPVVAVVVDLAFQSVRFPAPRFPDSALATGLFLALLLPPSVSLVSAAALVVAAIGLKHVLRYQGRAVLNPAAAGVVVGAFLFGVAPGWWAGVGPWGVELLIALGLALLLRSPAGWRIPATFFAVYAPLSIVLKAVVGASLAPKLLLLGVLDPATLFFGLFMVVEPRTAPANPLVQPVYAASVAGLAVFLPLVIPGPGVLVALLLANLGAVCVRFALEVRPAPAPASVPPAGEGRSRRNRRRYYRAERPRRTEWPAWSIARRATAGILLSVLVGTMAAVAYSPGSAQSVNFGLPYHPGGSGTAPGGSGSPGSKLTVSCTKDNASIPSSTLDSLHRALGPSVILSYDSQTGTTVFYDPVNSVTVTETDLFEDYGSAEFNGDDYAVPGCSP